MDRTSSLAVGLAMNARGAMEIILGILALQAGLIWENMFVAMVIMAFTSLVSAPAIHFLIRRRRSLTLKDTVTAKEFAFAEPCGDQPAGSATGNVRSGRRGGEQRA